MQCAEQVATLYAFHEVLEGVEMQRPAKEINDIQFVNLHLCRDTYP